ncbi:MAG TPA: phosphatidylglycerophosphatase A, partial [Acidobacteriaceae bacterium]|nr:phosphatidylglycerophosphatase A [Acidobacteriaceae bacterium]
MKPAAGLKMTMTTIEARSRTAWAWLTGTFLGIGLLPGGPGTWAAGATAVIWYFAVRGAHPSPAALTIGTLIALAAVTFAGIPAASVVERESGRQDPGHVVIDEVAGQLTALLLAP